MHASMATKGAHKARILAKAEARRAARPAHPKAAAVTKQVARGKK
jgi:hypothetical protein